MISTYNFDLYQPSGEQELPNGLSNSIVNFINQRQDRVFLTDYGTTVGVSVSGSPPHESNSIKLKPRYLKGQGTPIILTSLMVANGFMLIGREEIVISKALFPTDSGINQQNYFSYMTCASILGYYVEPLTHKHHEIFQCPYDSLVSADFLVAMMTRGRLCDKCEELIKEHIDKGLVEQSLILSITNVLKDIALHTKNGGPYSDTSKITTGAEIAKQQAVDSNIDKAGHTLKAETRKFGLSGSDVTFTRTPTHGSSRLVWCQE